MVDPNANFGFDMDVGWDQPEGGVVADMPRMSDPRLPSISPVAGKRSRTSEEGASSHHSADDFQLKEARTTHSGSRHSAVDELGKVLIVSLGFLSAHTL